MDKQRARAKSRRREERRQQRQAEEKQLADRLNAKCKAAGIEHRYKPGEVGREYRKVQTEIVEEAIVTNTVAALYTMRRLYGYGAKRLHRLAGEIAVLVAEIGRGNRSAAQLEDMLRTDAHLDISRYWPEQRTVFDDARRRELLAAYARQTAAVQITAIFYTLFPMGSISHRSRRMERIAEGMAATAEYCIKNNKLDNYIAELNACGLHITRDGQFGSKKLTEEENERIKRRVIT